jgi:homoserine kinase
MAAMVFVDSPVRVKVPASSSNLGPGFDSLAVALGLYDTVAARLSGNGIHVIVSGEGEGELPTDERHLVAAAMCATFEQLGHKLRGLELFCENEIPQERGLGSSAAAITAGIMLARHLVRDGPSLLDEAAVIKLAAEIEGHPDNVAACMLGGFTIAWREAAGLSSGGGVRALRMKGVRGVQPIIFVPAHRGRTAQARATLPATVPLKDAYFNASRTALLMGALTGAPELLLEATEDRLHQGYRARAMPETAKLIAVLREMGLAAVVSGAGPSVLVLAPYDQDLVSRAQSARPDGWWARPIAVAAQGAQLLRA